MISTSDSVTVEETVHTGQQAVLASPARFRVLACGRRWGKTTTCAMAIRDKALEAGENDTMWWVAPTYQQAKIGLRKLLEITPDALIADINRSALRVTFVSGAVCEFKSGDKPDHLRGEGLVFLVLDEAPAISRYAWDHALRPTLTDSPDSRMMAIGTPMGRNVFHDHHQRGNSPDYPEWQSWQRPSSENPFINQADIETARQELPERAFRQEYLAEFIDDSGGVFTRVRERNVQDYDYSEYDGAEPYYLGVDFARHEDYTVIIALDSDGQLCHFDRVRQTGWPQIQRRIERAYATYPGQTKVDATRDNKIIGDLEDSGVAVDPVTFTAATKRDLIENLAAALENGEVLIPDIPELINELEIFEYETTRAGNVRYGAPEGFHDDCVDALALANAARLERRGTAGAIHIDW